MDHVTVKVAELTRKVGQVLLAWNLGVCSILRFQVRFYLPTTLGPTDVGGVVGISPRCTQASSGNPALPKN